MSDNLLFDTTFVIIFFGVLIVLAVISAFISETHPEHADLMGAFAMILSVIYWTLLVLYEMGAF